MGLVVDSTVALAWCLADEISGQADLVLSLLQGTHATVPAHWELEVLNGLRAAERRERIAPGDASRLMRLLEALPVRSEAPVRGPHLRMTHHLAVKHLLGAFDAAYLELAARRGVQLVTMDPALAAAAREEGVGG